MSKRSELFFSLVGGSMRLTLAEAKHLSVIHRKELNVSAERAFDGQLIDSEGIADEVSFFIRHKTSGHAIKRVHAVIDSTRVVWRVAEFMAAGEKQLKKALASGISDYFPFGESGEYIYSCRILGSERGKYRLLLAAVPTALAEAYIKLFGGLGLELVSLDAYANRLGYFLESLAMDGDILGYYGSGDAVTFVYVKNGVLSGVRALPSGEPDSGELNKLFGYYFQTDGFDAVYDAGGCGERIRDFFVSAGVQPRDLQTEDAQWKISTCCRTGTRLSRNSKNIN